VAVLVALTAGLCVWLVTWALWLKPFDAFLFVFLFVLPAAAWQIYGPYIKRLLGAPEPPGAG
jgi:hypothetical protein